MRRVILWACVAGVLAGCEPGEPAAGDKPRRDGFATDRELPRGDDPKRPKFAEDRDPKKGDPKAEVKVEFDGERAVKHVKELCDIGPRISGSDGMKKQQELLVKHFEDLGGKVSKQEFEAKQKSRKAAVGMTNLVVSWFPERKTRVILCAHYDTRPQADQEASERNWNKPFASANDGTSGVAFLMELARHMKDLPTAVGVDFVLFDGEEYVFTGPLGEDEYFFGSKHFADEYKKAAKTRKHTYTAAVLFDLCFHDGANLKVEDHSWDGAKQLVIDLWGIAESRKAKSFKFLRGFDRGTAVLDDHVALLGVGIPAVDVIDFDYAHWHKLSDTPDKISAKQMTEVAGVIVQWLGGLKEK